MSDQLKELFTGLNPHDAKEKLNDFAKIVEPVMEWLNNNHNPRTKIIINRSSVELVEGIMAHGTDKFIKD